MLTVFKQSGTAENILKTVSFKHAF